MIDAGTLAPDFTLPISRPVTGVEPDLFSIKDGMLTLSALRPHKVVLYFYPKDDTPGCTVEALDFTSLAKDFAALDVAVLGISRDSIAKHDKFCTKHALGIPLLSDEAGDVCMAYGTWVEKTMYGRRSMGIQRATVLIGADGTVAQVWPKVSVTGHAQEVLAAARALPTHD